MKTIKFLFTLIASSNGKIEIFVNTATTEQFNVFVEHGHRAVCCSLFKDATKMNNMYGAFVFNGFISHEKFNAAAKK